MPAPKPSPICSTFLFGILFKLDYTDIQMLVQRGWKNFRAGRTEWCLKVEKIFRGEKHTENRWRFIYYIFASSRTVWGSTPKKKKRKRFIIRKNPLRSVVETHLFFSAFIMFYRAQIIYWVLFLLPISISLHFVTFYSIYK